MVLKCIVSADFVCGWRACQKWTKDTPSTTSSSKTANNTRSHCRIFVVVLGRGWGSNRARESNRIDFVGSNRIGLEIPFVSNRAWLYIPFAEGNSSLIPWLFRTAENFACPSRAFDEWIRSFCRVGYVYMHDMLLVCCRYRCLARKRQSQRSFHLAVTDCATFPCIYIQFNSSSIAAIAVLPPNPSLPSSYPSTCSETVRPRYNSIRQLVC
jgi:hypothetical protein